MSQDNNTSPNISTEENDAEKGKTLYTLIIFSENLAGVLNQVTNAFTRRQLNIESLNVSPSGMSTSTATPSPAILTKPQSERSPSRLKRKST